MAYQHERKIIVIPAICLPQPRLYSMSNPRGADLSLNLVHPLFKLLRMTRTVR